MASGCCCATQQKTGGQPQRLVFTWQDYFKVFFSWLNAYRQTFKIEPGLYFFGEVYDAGSPLLVTGNYHMTVFILWRIIKKHIIGKQNVRLLIIDTKGINVWCASGKGQFSASEVMKQLNRYDRALLTNQAKIRLILPKLSLSGVSLAELQRQDVIPVIGPIYADDLPAYLTDIPLKDRNEDVYRFDLKDRLFTFGPSLMQVIRYSFFIFVPLFIWHYFFHTNIHWQVFPILGAINLLYIVLFPFLPTKKFAIKGLALFVLMALSLTLYYTIINKAAFELWSFLFYLAFLAGANLFYALYYTGNSGVSNYSLVKKEIITFLPYTAVCFLGAAVLLIIKGVVI
jgi:hypothetical protein